MSQYEELAQMQGLTPAQMCELLPYAVADKQRERYLEISMAARQNWEEVKKILCDKIQPSRSSEAVISLTKRKMTSDETLDDFVKDLKRLAKEAWPTIEDLEPIVFGRFKEGIDPRLRAHLVGMKVKNTAMALEEAKEIETTWGLNEVKTPRVGPSTFAGIHGVDTVIAPTDVQSVCDSCSTASGVSRRRHRRGKRHPKKT
jgi:hypothetical protein